LVSSVWELRCFGRAWILVAAAVAAVDIALGGLFDLTELEIWGCVLLFFLSVAGAPSNTILGLRTQPDMQYALIFDRSPPPPAALRIEPGRSTAARAVWAAAGVALMLAVVAAATLVVLFVLLGRPREHVLDHLAGAAAVVAAGWTLICALASFRIAVWFHHWEERRGRTVLCRPLTSGRLGYVYYVGSRGGAGR